MLIKGHRKKEKGKLGGTEGAFYVVVENMVFFFQDCE
jgi:hypothetical protein